MIEKISEPAEEKQAERTFTLEEVRDAFIAGVAWLIKELRASWAERDRIKLAEKK